MDELKSQIFFHEGKPINNERGYGMNATRQQLHSLIDAVDSKELDILYQVLVKFIPIDEPSIDEIEAIRLGRDEILRGETVNHADINWD